MPSFVSTLLDKEDTSSASHTHIKLASVANSEKKEEKDKYIYQISPAFSAPLPPLSTSPFLAMNLYTQSL